MIRDLAIKNRSYRGYDRSRRITRKEMEDFIDLTRFVASSVNDQPLKYYIAWEEEQVAQVQALTGWARGLPDLDLPFPGTEPAAFIVICIDRNLVVGGRNYLRDVGAVAQTILLSAVEKGLGGCMLGTFKKDGISELFSIPENIEPNLLVALGKPDEKIVITDAEDGKTAYYRDESRKVHYVPKRSLDDILMN